MSLEEDIAKARGVYEKTGVRYIGYKRHTYATYLGPVAIFRREEGNEIFYVALQTLEVLTSGETSP